MFNRSSSDVNISQIIRLANEIKLSIYKVVYLMMKQGEESLYVSIFFSIVQFLQLTYLAFGSKIMYVWNNEGAATDLSNILSQLFKQSIRYFVISAHLKHQKFELYLAFFYAFFGLVVISIALFVIFAFAFKVAVLPLMILKSLLKLFLTIGFLPIMLLFFGILSCKVNSNGIEVWSYNADVECWGNDHYIHAIFAIIAILLFQILTSTTCLIYFESKFVYGNAFAQRSGRPYSYYHINVFIIIMSYQLLETPRFSSLLLAIFTISSFFLFYQIHTEKPFYNKVIQKLWSIITALNMWTSIMLIFAYLLEGQFFRDVIWGWVGGIPLIVLIIVNEQLFEVDLLGSNINRAISGQQIIILCEYLLSLLDKNDQHSSLMLDGFIEVHKQTCYRNDCILKFKKSLNEKNKYASLHDMERYTVFIELISQIYYDGIKQFPQDVFLRLNYSYFLIDRLKLKQQALSELQQAESSGPSFDHEFIIYRYKRIMEDDLQEQQQENINQVDLVTEIAFQTQSKQLIQQIEKTSLIYIDFWAQLQEEVPDIGRINNLGFKILDSVNLVQEQWNRLKRLNQKASKLNRLMGKYYSQIMNDEEMGQKLIQQSRMNQNDKFKAIDLEEIQNECLPTITILTDVDKIGTISNLNKAACSLLGYAKTDLVNRKLNLIQPDLFSKYHDHFLENFLEKYQDNNPNQQVKEKSIYVKNKQGYIIPCQLNIRMIQTINSGVFMCGTIKQDIYHKPISIFLCQTNGIIENINSTCIRMFGLELKSITIKPVNILDIFPDIFDRKEELLQKAGGILTYVIGTRSSKTNTSHNSLQDLEIEHSQILDHQNKQQIQFQCYLQEIKFQCIEDEIIQNKLQGYIIKLDKFKSPEKMQLYTQNKSIQNQFQFKFNYLTLTYVLDFGNGLDSQDPTVKVDQSIIWEDQTKVSQQVIIDPQIQGSDCQTNYAEGIKIVRLIGDRIVEIEESKSDEYEDDNMQSLFQQNENNEDDQKNEKDTINLYRSKNQLEQLLSQSKIPRTAINFRIFINIMTLVLVLITFLEYFINSDFNQKLLDSMPLVSWNNQRSSTLMGIQSVIQDLKSVHYDQLPLLKDPEVGYTIIEKQFRGWFDKELTQLIQLQKDLTLVSAEINDDYKWVQDYYEMEIVEMVSLEGGKQNYTFNEAVQSAIAKALQINSSSLDEINDQNGDVYYIEYNVFNSITQSLTIPAEYFKYNIISRGEILETSVTAFLTAALFNSIILEYIQVVNQAALQLFLDLNEKKIKSIYVKCENFITSLQVGDDDDDDQFFSDNDDKEEENENKEKEKEEGDNLLNGRKKRKKFRNSNQNYKHLIFALLLVIEIMAAYFIYLFVSVQSETSDIIDLIPVFNQTSFAECYYRYSDNALRKALEVEQYTFVGNSSVEVLNFLIAELYNLDAAIHQIHSSNSGILNSDYLDVFNNIFILTPCDYIVQIDTQITYDICLNFNDGVLQQGLSIGMAKYFGEVFSASPFNSYQMPTINLLRL
ncbi:unnamed protein product (macronuclear) [Paramecium tetraurelia]|uniref:PAS domain-containing protein n=1 Tax=Paramecium tetraurelia TaxID=5888 RepID=A0E7G9_PARTE|nr:uncharacterized protein GSPATT00023964001 [Paramecium tetraurelia]CAK91236.1 unnamed protein product [Paramecium tetraurelia]|eukprot:XP_001458633.1 hypothetical protein (macronuclear) [Paramecium tetraurelia strain d4-2]